MKRQKFLITALIVAALSAAAYAHTGATGIVKERMDAMGVMSKAVNSIAKMMRGETPYNADTVVQGAVLIRQHSGETMTKLFPEGSLPKVSVAKPDIWNDWEEFVSLANQLGILAEGLEAAAENGPMMAGGENTDGQMMGNRGANMMDTGTMMGGNMAMGGEQNMMLEPEMLAQMPADNVFNMLAQTCSSCHTKFRIEKK